MFKGEPERIQQFAQQIQGLRLTRRELVAAGIKAGIGLSALQFLLAGCGTGAKPAAGDAPKLAAAEAGAPKGALVKLEKEVDFFGWSYEPDIVQANLDRWSQNFGVKVNFQHFPGNQWRQKMVTLFQAGTNVDAMYVRDDDLAAWVDAGYLRPLDGMPGVDKLLADLRPANREAMTLNGKLYGLPYYTTPSGMHYNEEHLKQAGYSKPPETLDELQEMSLKMKQDKVVEWPLMFGWKASELMGNEFWDLLYGAGGSLFDKNTDPVFPDQDDRIVKVVQWLHDGIHKHKFIDPKSFESENVSVAMQQGETTFQFTSAYVAWLFNDKSKSKAAGQIKLTTMPSLTKNDKKGNLFSTRMYGISPKAKNPGAAYQLIYYMGGQDWDGKYHTAKNWFTSRGLGHPYKPLDSDKEIIDSASSWLDLQMFGKLMEIGRVREAQYTPWYPEWWRFMQQKLSEALRGIQPVEKAMAEAAAKAKELKKQWS